MPHKDPEARRAYRRAYYQKNRDKWAEYYTDHAEERKAYIAAWRLANPVKKYPNKNPRTRPPRTPEELARRREEYARNRDENRARSRAYAAAHRAEASARARRWFADNRERAAAGRMARRGRLLGAFVEKVERGVVYEMHGGRCGICGEFIQGEFHVDHVIPLSRGGVHSYANTQPAHLLCNRRKAARLPAEMEEISHAA